MAKTFQRIRELSLRGITYCLLFWLAFTGILAVSRKSSAELGEGLRTESLIPSALLSYEELIAAWGFVPVVNSVCRTAKHNREVGGAKDSAHLDKHCSAFDISTVGWTKEERKERLEVAKRLGWSIGTYPTHIHIDRKTIKPRYWKGH